MLLISKYICEITCVIALLTAITRAAWGEPITTIRNNGDSANRVDLVILGDGYTAAEINKYSSDVEIFVQGLFAQQPFSDYQRYFNVHRVDVISSESGADHPEKNPAIFRDTALDAYYNCAGIARLICFDMTKVNDVLSRSVPPDRREVILIIVNDTEYGGSGGPIAVASIHSSVVELVLHELGHSFGLLADEYTDNPPDCDNTVEPPQPNVTKETFRSLIKWNVGGGPPTGWIELSTPVPTNSSTPGIPGLYQGAKYCTIGLYRPTFNSKMRSLDVPFEQINSEQLVKRIYNWASPIDSSNPPEPTVTLAAGQTQTFAVEVPQPLNHALEVAWQIDGNTAGTGKEFTFSGSTVGSHTLEVFVSDPTGLVRNDPASVLKESRRWNIIVEAGLIFSANPASIAPGGTLTATWNGIISPTSTDWIGLYQLGTGNTAFIEWIYVSCSQSAGSARPSGSCPIVLPAMLSSGTYELRLLANDGFTHLVVSNVFTVASAAQAFLR